MRPILIIPGRGGSGEAHWQTHLQRALPAARRVEQADWDAPDLRAWARRIDTLARRCETPPLAIAHSFGCLALAAADRLFGTPIAASFLVAPAEPARFGIADVEVLRPLAHPSDLLASTDDPWLQFSRVEELAEAWGARLHVLGALGHINVDSGFGPWPAMEAWARAGEIERLDSPISVRSPARVSL